MGLATVELFVAEGARVVFCDLAPESDEDLVARIGAVKAAPHHRGREKGGPHDGWAIADRLGDAAYFVPADVTDARQLEAVVAAAVERYGGLDIMYNNAGIAALEGPIIDSAEELFDRTIDVNLKAVWRGIKLAAPLIIERGGGSIISTASAAGLTGIPNLTAYCAAKAGVVGITRSAAIELAASGVRVNCICPGTIATQIAKATFGPDFDLEAMEAGLPMAQPMPRTGVAMDIAGAALWLASDESSFVTGQAIAVDGGATIEFSAFMRPASAPPA
jgi:NAD(P)-dependent dehydrogenase (short-subunit alcohol dehydrogenase family)